MVGEWWIFDVGGDVEGVQRGSLVAEISWDWVCGWVGLAWVQSFTFGSFLDLGHWCIPWFVLLIFLLCCCFVWSLYNMFGLP